MNFQKKSVSLFYHLRLIHAALLSLMCCFSALVQAADVQGLRLYRAPDNTRLVFDLTGAVDHNVQLMPKQAAQPERLMITISNTALNVKADTLELKGTPITQVHVSRVNDFDLQVVLDLSADITPKSFMLKPNAPYGYRLVIDMADVVVNPPAETNETPPTSQPAATKPETKPEAEKTGRDILIVVDAGHGGEDPGASGPHGIHEKDITLKIAKELASVINQQKGYRALLTRATDYFIPLQGRSKIAVDKKADLFIAIHADAFKDKSAEGASVFAWSQRGATSTTAKFLADSENLSDLMGGADPDGVDDMVAKVVADLSIDGNVNYSLAMGRDILDQIGKITRLHKHHVEQAGFMVLKSVRVPSLLVETGFISNPTEAGKLTSPDYQHQLAVAIFAGIDKHFSKVPPPGTYIAATKDGSNYTAPVHANTNNLAINNDVTSSSTPANSTPTDPVPVKTVEKKPDPKPAIHTVTHQSVQKTIVHVVKRGDTLTDIAAHYGVSMAAIKKQNKLKSSKVFVGQRLKIPVQI